MVTPRPRYSSGAPMRSGVGRIGIASAETEWRRSASSAFENRRAQSRHRPSRGSQPGVLALTSETRSGSIALAGTRSSAAVDRWQVGQWKGRSAASEGTAGEEA